MLFKGSIGETARRRMCKVSGNTAIGMNGRRIGQYRTEARLTPAHLPRTGGPATAAECGSKLIVVSAVGGNGGRAPRHSGPAGRGASRRDAGSGGAAVRTGAAVSAQGAGRGGAVICPGPSFARASGGGVAREQADGIAPDAPNRNYRDRNHKPEVAVALEPYWMMSGIRCCSEVVRHLKAVGVPELRAATVALRQRPTERALGSLLATALQLNDRQRADLVSRTVEHAASQLRAGDRGTNAEGTGPQSGALTEAEAAARWVERLAVSYPGDAGILAPYLLNVVHLAPGEGIFTGAGTLNAALSGTAAELQANSDDVLRGDLAVKHVDAPELLRVARFAPQDAAVLNPAAEFALSSVALDSLPRDTGFFSATVGGPEIRLFLHGDAVVIDAQGRSLDCRAGEALFVPATVAGYRARGTGLLFRARVPEPDR